MERAVIIGTVCLLENGNHSQHFNPESLFDINVGANGQVEKLAPENNGNGNKSPQDETDYGPDAAFASQWDFGSLRQLLNGNIGIGTFQKVLNRGYLHFGLIDLLLKLGNIGFHLAGDRLDRSEKLTSCPQLDRGFITELDVIGQGRYFSPLSCDGNLKLSISRIAGNDNSSVCIAFR